MATVRTSIHGYWSSRFAFVLAAAGSAVGLGKYLEVSLHGRRKWWRGFCSVVFTVYRNASFAIPVMMSEVLLGTSR